MPASYRNRVGVILGLMGACALGATQSAHAQSSVTLYGVLDASLLYTNKTLDTANGQSGPHQYSFNDSGVSGSHFGLRGVEDLGGGLRAIFQLESGISMANGALSNSNGNLFGRQAWIGIDSKYGTVKAGLQFSPFFLAAYDFDPRNMSYFGSGLVSYINNVYVTGMFNPNGVSYTSPEIAGLQASALMALGGTAGDFQAGRQYSASLRYHLGTLVVDAALYSGNAGGSAATIAVPSAIEFNGRALGASYTFSNLTVKASYVQYKIAGSFNDRVYSGGASYRVTPALNVDAGVWVTRDANNSSNNSVLASTGVEYSLSKATMTYAQVGFVTNHGATHTGLSVNNALNLATGTTAGANIGIRHTF
ncbi:Outer membrane protein (porin) [Paraburkholderia fungorum]|uniref:Outer membrane protein (Porin) n=1 Tax=Paraburkholderia fungorum TaxID=134537 RepID=A0A1H1HV33_9BURK|nr:Outer membrane protein (porin) [Paraburkholderia fungorum]